MRLVHFTLLLLLVIVVLSVLTIVRHLYVRRQTCFELVNCLPIVTFHPHASFQVFELVQLKTAFLCDVALRHKTNIQ